MSKKQQRRRSDVRNQLIDRIVATRPKSSVLQNRGQINLYLREYFRDVPYEDMTGRSPRSLAHSALTHLELGRRKRKGQSLVSIFNPSVDEHGFESSYTIVEMVNDNMPFLVDSVAAAIMRHDLDIHITVHPVLRVKRDSKSNVAEILSFDSEAGRLESFVHFVVDKETDKHELKLLENEIHRALADIRLAVRDWVPMRIKMLEAREILQYGPQGADSALRQESQALLQWMADDHFTFLGYREYKLRSRGEKMFLKPMPGTGLGVLAHEKRGGGEIELTPQMKRLTRQKDWLVITKANSRSTVHRHSYLDYVGIKKYDDEGNPIGEMRFLGLFTSIAYSENPRNIPLLRLKVRRVVERSGYDPAGHLGKSLLHILDNFPRDELFQASIQDLSRTTAGILNLQERHKVRLFIRRDTFRRFYSCIIYVPREKYTTEVRRRIEQILLTSFGGTGVDTSVEISDSLLARVHIIVRIPVGDLRRISIDSIENEIAEAVVTWRDRLRSCLDARYGVEQGHKLFRAFGESFSPAYEGEVDTPVACLDVKRLDGLLRGEHNDYLLFHRPENAGENQLNFRTFRSDEPFRLSNVLPILEDMGVEVYGERPYKVRLHGREPFWIQDFELRYPGTEELNMDIVAARFQECFDYVITGRAENDGFNRLVLAACLNWRDVSLLRCYGKYLQQLGIPFSQDYLEDVLADHPQLVRALVAQFRNYFDTSFSAVKRKREAKQIRSNIKNGLKRAKTLDEDRILRAFAGVIDATLR
ncbi:MAG: NAD-glutamate dehydrogenase, partial [Pseudomonadota bacterium]